jgi:H(+)-translocating pyrophosphatase
MSIGTAWTLAQAQSLPGLLILGPVGGVAALLTAWAISRGVMRRDEGDEEMIRVAAAVKVGAMAYLRSQFRVVAVVFALLVAALVGLWLAGLQPFWSAVGVPLAGGLSGLCGWFGMKMATNASARTAAAARRSLNDGLQVAFRAGAVMGLTVVGLAILDVSFWTILFTRWGESLGIRAGLPEVVAILISYKMGASLQALFARVGGGIFTKAADVGADLVGKVEAGIPEDDPRNPATIADNVGDNVGDVAGMGADLYESYYSSVIAALALGTGAALSVHALGEGARMKLALALAVAPIALAGIGILASIAGVYAVRTRESATFGQLLDALNRGVYLASLLIVAASFGVPYLLLGADAEFATVLRSAGVPAWWCFGVAICAGLASGLVIARWTEYCTSYEHPPTRRIAIQALTGPATVIIAGIAEGMKSTWGALVAVVTAILIAFIAAGGGENFLMGLYGVGIAAVGMLSTLGITLATDAYGPIADNAGGNAEMSGQKPEVRHRTDMLDSLGNTTAATGKGFAIGSAALTAMALLAAFVQVALTQLHAQTTDLGRRSSAVVAPGTMRAVYQGHGRFAILRADPDGRVTVDGGLLTDRSGLSPAAHWEAVARPGTALQAEPVQGHDGRAGHAYRLTLRASHGDHEHEYDFEVVSTTHATIADVLDYYDVTLTNPRVLGGLFLGVMITFLFCALTMNAVGRAAYLMMGECRRQFAAVRAAMRARGAPEADIADPHRWPRRIEHEGVEYPDYARCVTIATRGALREMVLPSMLSIIVPLLVGLLLDVPGIVGMLAGGLAAGFAVAVFMANAGGAWDNAKKLIESYGRITADQYLDDPQARDRLPQEIRQTLLARAEELRRAGRGSAYIYGKGSDDHKAAVVGDTVGDPFKDTSGPSLNILIKLLSSVSVVFAGLIVKYAPIISGWLGLG